MASDVVYSSTNITNELLSKFERLNENQQKVVTYNSGPLLVLAGPGSGKTECLTICALNLLMLGKADPSQIILCTYTEKAAHEIQDRILEIATDIGYGYTNKISQIRVDTIHGMCSRFISENAHRFPDFSEELATIDSNFQTLGELSQRLFIFNYLEEICGQYAQGFIKFWGSRWEATKQLQKHFDKITEELIDLQALRLVDASQLKYVDEVKQKKEASLLRHLAEPYQTYRKLLFGFDYVDFAHLQRIVYDLLGNPETARWIRSDIKYVFVDEYQDTNYIQEQLLFKLTAETNNLCVVGDEDQSLYRFRGATAQNIGEFYQKNPDRMIRLTTNYRSHAKIINTYNDWMASISWGIFRSNKGMKPAQEKDQQYPAVFSIDGTSYEDEAEQLAEMILFLKEQGKITDYDQIALLMHSVKSGMSKVYIKVFQEKHIPVFCSRAGAYFEQKEVCLLVGCFVRIFRYTGGTEMDIVGENEFQAFIKRCLNLLAKECEKSSSLEELLQQIEFELLLISNGDEFEKRFTDLFYALLSVEPFSALVKNKDEKAVYNLGKFSRLMHIFENFYHYDNLNRDNLEDISSTFFNRFLCLLQKDGDNESEDPDVSFPKGYMPIMTIHQAKGLEFPVVIVGGLDRKVSNGDSIDDRRLRQFYLRPHKERENLAPTFDFMRLFYVAFSRAINLLVLTSNRRKQPSNEYLKKLIPELPKWPYIQGDLGVVTPFHTKSLPMVRPRFSFTSVQMYETCPRKYQFYREFRFVPSRPDERFFGLLVHQTIEKIHRFVLDGELATLSEARLRVLFEQTLYSLSQGNMRSLEATQREKAYEQVLNYYVNNLPEMCLISKAEEQISIIEDDYVLTGTIDLVSKRGKALEILDLKTSRRPENDSDSMESYERQLCLYAHALERRDSIELERLLLYWTEESRREDALMVVPYDPEKVEAFKYVVGQIKKKQFEVLKIPERRICLKCDIRNLCTREGLIEP